MAVYTEVSFNDAAALTTRLGLGRLQQLRGIESGIENTNYFATTDKGEWVLTVFERLTIQQLPYYLALMQHLAKAGLPVPQPQSTARGELVHSIMGKPAAVVSRLSGAPEPRPQLVHCTRVGRFLGRMHKAGESFGQRQQHERGLPWWEQTVPEVLPHVPADVGSRLRSELSYLRTALLSPAGTALPQGHIHADLFRDNAMFEVGAGDPVLSGVLDFYFAGVDALLFDVAVAINDWCIDDESGRIDYERAQGLVDAYRIEREWAHGEWRMLPAMLRAAAFRFWLSRLWDWHLPRSASLLKPKDPTQFERILQDRIDNPWLPSA
jgi:homoserine kinase type II